MTPLQKDYPITIGDKTYKFRMNFAAITLAQDTYGKPFLSLILGLTVSDLKALAILLYAGLHKHHDLTLEEVYEIMDACDLAELGDSLGVPMEEIMNHWKPKDKTAKKKLTPELVTEA